MAKKKIENSIEKRFMPFIPAIEVRTDDNGQKVIEGYALKYNVLSRRINWGFREKIDSKALDNTNLDDVVSTLNHSLEKMLGRNVSKTLTLEKRTDGLFYTVIPPKTGAGPEAIELIERGDISGSSFIFETNIRGDAWEDDDENGEIRTLLDIKRIYELGPVANPAYVQTEASVAKRSNDEWKNENKPPEPEASAEVKHARYHADLLKKKYN